VKDRHIIFHETWGWSDREREMPLERNSIYRIRSMTKPFVGTAVLMLVEQGLVRLDDRVADVLPSFDNDRSGEITVRQLLNHTSGHRQGDFPDGYWESGNLRDAVDLIGQRGPPDPPGRGYNYSDLNSATLGALVVELTGMLAEEYLAAKVFEPLGLDDTHTFFETGVPWASRMNSTYWRQGDGWWKYWDNTRQQTTPFFRASGGIYTTVFDYAKWLSVFMDRGSYVGGELLSEETVIEALTARESEHYGYHWEVLKAANDESDLPAFGHGGSDGTLAMAIPRHDLMVLYFTQSRGQRTTGLYRNKVLMLFEP
jgi:CubicO group peptidase (beta-lactamase class C family)